MGKEKDYLDKIEEYRQEVELDDVSKTRTRTRRTRNQNNAPKSPMMKILVVIFIFIPLSILGYVWFFYEPEVETVTPETDNSIVHIEKNNNTSSSSTNTAVVEDKENKEETDKKDEEQNSSNASSEDVEVNEEEQQAIDKATQEAEEKLKEQQKVENKEEGQSTNSPQAKTHVVQVNDTLFSIAMKYYKDPTKVEAIKRANNLSSDSISLGSKLILP